MSRGMEERKEVPGEVLSRLRDEAWDETGQERDILDPNYEVEAMLRFGVKELEAELEITASQDMKAHLRKAIAKAKRDLKLMLGDEYRGGDGYKPGITHRELMAMDFPPIQWVVQDLLPVGCCVLAGKPKVGKSFMALQLAQAVASGSPFLGMKTTKAPVLMIALEDSPRRIKGRLQMQKASSDLPICYEWQWQPLDGKGLEHLSKRLERGGPAGPYGLVVIDTLASAKSGKVDENKASDMSQLIYPLQRLAHDYQCALLLVFHHKKGAVNDPIWDVRGSGAIPGAVDVLVGLYKDRSSGDYCLLSESRDAPELELRVEFEAAQTFSWQLVGNLNDMAKTEAEEEVIEALEDLVEADAGTIGKELDKSRQNVRKVCKRLKNRGILNSQRVQTASGSTKILYSLSYIERGTGGAEA